MEKEKQLLSLIEIAITSEKVRLQLPLSISVMSHVGNGLSLQLVFQSPFLEVCFLK